MEMEIEHGTRMMGLGGTVALEKCFGGVQAVLVGEIQVRSSIPAVLIKRPVDPPP